MNPIFCFVNSLMAMVNVALLLLIISLGKTLLISLSYSMMGRVLIICSSQGVRYHMIFVLIIFEEAEVRRDMADRWREGKTTVVDDNLTFRSFFYTTSVLFSTLQQDRTKPKFVGLNRCRVMMIRKKLYLMLKNSVFEHLKLVRDALMIHFLFPSSHV